MEQETIHIKKLNEIFVQLNCFYTIENKLKKWFSVKIPNAQFSPAYKQGRWDGNISFYDDKYHTLPIGMLYEFFKFCNHYHYEYQFDFDVGELFNNISSDTIEKMIEHLLKDTKYTLRDYQFDAVKSAINRKHGVVLSATGSGKSLIIYILVRYLLLENKNVLLIVPRSSLVEQLYSDFVDYGWKHAEEMVCRLHSGNAYDIDKPVLISTWQSVFKKEHEFFKRFGGLVVDECVSSDTNISIDNGIKSIENVMVGDQVWSFDEETNEKQLKPVKKVFEKPVKSIIFTIEFENGTHLNISGNHEVKTQRGWISADQLKMGDDIQEF